jgi:D-amino-acid oxidase
MAEKMDVLRGLVEEVVVGYRPSREGGPRVERGSDLEIDLELDHGHILDSDLDTRGAGQKSSRKVKVFYNYGHGGAGWQACWGAAEETRDLVLAAEGV